MSEKRFGTCLNCIDGIFQLPVMDWIKKNYNIDYVDMITEIGMAEKIAQNTDKFIGHIVKNIKHSLDKNKSEIIFIVGYEDILNRLIEKKCVKEDVTGSIVILKSLFPNCEIVGLWVATNWKIELIHEQK